MQEALLYAVLVQLVYVLDHLYPTTGPFYAIPKAPPLGLLPSPYPSPLMKQFIPSGAFSIVRRLDRPPLQDPIILKEIHAPPFLRRLLPLMVWQEVYALKRVHGLTCAPQYLGHWSSRPREMVTLAMSHVGNINLQQLGHHPDSQTILVRHMRFLAAEMASILRALHRRGLTHNDVQPANFVLGEDGHVRIVDFGLAKVRSTGHDGKSRLHVYWQQILLVGYTDIVDPALVTKETPEWEDLVAGDWFALGATLHYLLTGKYPVREAYAGRLQHHLSQVDPNLENLVNGLLARRGKRLTDFNGGWHRLMKHPYWQDVEWLQHEKFSIVPPPELVELAQTFKHQASPAPKSPPRSALLSRL